MPLQTSLDGGGHTFGAGRANHNRSWWMKGRGREERRGHRRALFEVAAELERGDRKGGVRRRSASANDSKAEAARGPPSEGDGSLRDKPELVKEDAEALKWLYNELASAGRRREREASASQPHKRQPWLCKCRTQQPHRYLTAPKSAKTN